MNEDQETPEAASQEPEADFKPKGGRAGKPRVVTPQTKFRKVVTREYESGTSRTLENGLIVSDS